MIRQLSLVFALLLPALPHAAELDTQVFDDLLVPPSEAGAERFLWQNRLLLVFSDSPLEPRFAEQERLLRERAAALAERDVRIVLDTDPSAMSPLRTKYRPRGFMMMLIGKDGMVYLRKPAPWDVREISRSIDKLPLRQQEVEARRTP